MLALWCSTEVFSVEAFVSVKVKLELVFDELYLLAIFWLLLDVLTSRFVNSYGIRAPESRQSDILRATATVFILLLLLIQSHLRFIFVN